MPDSKKYPFLKVTVKDEQVTGKRIMRTIFKTIGKGLLFGLAACLAFFVLKPWVESRFAPETGQVSIPKDELEDAETSVGQKELEKLTAENYREMNEALREVAEEARKCTAEIYNDKVKDNWKNEEGNIQSVSGVIVWENTVEILILAPREKYKEQDVVLVRFSDGEEYQAILRSMDKNHNMAIFVVRKNVLDQETLKHIKVAELGNSYILGKGSPVIALGLQFGYSDGMGYGVISSTENQISISDYKYELITTDITAASQGSGVLFNIDGEVVALVDQKHTDVSDVNLVSGYAISELKGAIELLSNNKGIPYLGIRAIEVTDEISEKEKIPKGLYVKEVEAESPAMEAGIQCGDVIVKMGESDMLTQRGYENRLMNYSIGEHTTIEVMRLGAEEYENIKLNAVVGSK